MKSIKRSFEVTDQEIYIFIIKQKCKYCWLWLLILLPIFIFIPIKKVLKIKIIDIGTREVLQGKAIQFQYQKREVFSFSKAGFFLSQPYPQEPLIDTTNHEGIATFSTTTSLYQYISVWSRSQDTARAWLVDPICRVADSTYQYFQLRSNGSNELWYSIKRDDLSITVVDADDNNEPLPNAKVILNPYSANSVSSLSDQYGRVVFRDVPICGKMSVLAQKYGWHSDSIFYKRKEKPYGLKDTLYLRQEKEVIKFYVRDELNNEPLVGVKGELFFQESPSQRVGLTITNINGIAKGVFEEVHKVRSINIHVNRNQQYLEYSDTTSIKTQGWKTVEEWRKLSDQNKILYIHRNKIIFRTVARAIEGVPIPEATLRVIVNSRRLSIRSSGDEGEFVVPIPSLSSRISVVATKKCYSRNDTTVKNIAAARILQSGRRYTDIPLVSLATVHLRQCYNKGRPHVDFYLDGRLMNRFNTTTGNESGRYGQVQIAEGLYPGFHQLKFVISEGQTGEICEGCTHLQIPCIGVDENLANQAENVFRVNIPY